MPDTRICLIGCGAAAERYYVPALSELKALWDKLTFVDTDIERAKSHAARFQGAEAVADYRTVLGKVQGAILVVPHFLHHSLSKAFLEAGAHVLCEKPVAESSAQLAEMIDTAASRGVTLSVNNTRRMFPSFRKVRGLLSEDAIGPLRALEYYEGNSFAWPSATGFYVNPKVSSKGVLLDIGAHVVDTVCWWLGGEFTLTEYRDDSFGGPESVAEIRGDKDACEIRVFLNRLNELCNRFRLVGERGEIEGDIFKWDSVTITTRGGVPRRLTLDGSIRAYPEFVTPIVRNFLQVARGEAVPEIPAASVKDSIVLIERCYEQRTRFAMPWYERLEV